MYMSTLCVVQITNASASNDQEGYVETKSGLKYRDTRVGEGAEATKGVWLTYHVTHSTVLLLPFIYTSYGIPLNGTNIGDIVKVHYTGWLDGIDGKKKFDSSLDRGSPLDSSWC